MSTRRFTEDEIARIFEEAAKKQASPDPEDGLSLKELQGIGAASGLSPEAIAEAAKKFNYYIKLGERDTLLFNDVGVSAVAELPGRLSHADWHELLGEIRSNFKAAGKVSTESGGRMWRNGNLSVIVEEGKTRDRLRMATKNASRISLLQTAGGIFAGFGMAYGYQVIFGNADWSAMSFLLIAIGALSMIGLSRIRQKSWAGLRESQFIDLAETASRLVVDGETVEKLNVEELTTGYDSHQGNGSLGREKE